MDIRALLAEPGRLELVAQPIVDLRRGTVTGYEVLSRFEVVPRVSPDRVFAEAARQGLGADLEACVLTRALALAADRPDNCFLSVNVDPEHLLVPAVREVFARAPSLGGIVVELTEHRAVENVAALVRELDALRQRGAYVAVDDAGSGYSGLKQLLELRPQIIKLDRALVTGVDGDEAKRALIQMLGELAGRLDAWVLAEGIESASELRALKQLGVPLAQGYYLAKPAPPWAGILPQARPALSEPPPSLRGSRLVRRLLEPCATAGLDEAWPEATLAVRVTRDGRPVALRFAENGQVHTRGEHDLLRVKPESTLGAVAQRAATRPERLRWDPLVGIDDLGHFRGVVRLARLVCALGDEDVAAPLDVTIN